MGKPTEITDYMHEQYRESCLNGSKNYERVDCIKKGITLCIKQCKGIPSTSKNDDNTKVFKQIIFNNYMN